MKRTEQIEKINTAVRKTCDYFEAQDNLGVAVVHISEIDNNAIVHALEVGEARACEYGTMLQYFLGKEFDVCQDHPTDSCFSVTLNHGIPDPFDPAKRLIEAAELYLRTSKGEIPIRTVLDFYVTSLEERMDCNPFDSLLSTDDYLEQCIRIDHGIKDYYNRSYRAHGEGSKTHVDYIIRTIAEQVLRRNNFPKVTVVVEEPATKKLGKKEYSFKTVEGFIFTATNIVSLIEPDVNLTIIVEGLIR